MKKILFLMIILSGCDKDINYSNSLNYLSGATNYVQGIKYLRDERTKLCFAKKLESHEITCVPCTEEVNKLITTDSIAQLQNK